MEPTPSTIFSSSRRKCSEVPLMEAFLTASLRSFCKGVDVSGKAAEHVNDLGVFFGLGGELLDGLGLEEHRGELGGSDLEADLGKLAGVIFAEVIGEAILHESELELALLLGAPFLCSRRGFSSWKRCTG